MQAFLLLFVATNAPSSLSVSTRSFALEGGVHPLVVSERLGHSKVSITLDTYSHVTPALAEDAAVTIAARIAPE